MEGQRKGRRKGVVKRLERGREGKKKGMEVVDRKKDCRRRKEVGAGIEVEGVRMTLGRRQDREQERGREMGQHLFLGLIPLSSSDGSESEGV